MRLRFFAALTFVTTVIGCNGAPAGAPLAEPHPVQGKITFPDQTPLKGGVIYFTPTTIKAGGMIRYEAASLVDAKGHYILGFNGDNTGAAVGEYKVTIMPRDDQELPKSNSSRIPQKYQEKAITPLTVTVLEGDNTFDFVLK